MHALGGKRAVQSPPPGKKQVRVRPSVRPSGLRVSFPPRRFFPPSSSKSSSVFSVRPSVPRLRCRKKPISTTKISVDVSLRKTDGRSDANGRPQRRGRRRRGSRRVRGLLKSRSLHFRCVPHFALECTAATAICMR